ncbi:unnamed protein product [Linum trigynum]|uniref:Uncharacterized protein n=1 Tax=Linum trigynum TaxID=586398 RepID=A0AAV2EGD4_9ROSI
MGIDGDSEGIDGRSSGDRSMSLGGDRCGRRGGALGMNSGGELERNSGRHHVSQPMGRHFPRLIWRYVLHVGPFPNPLALFSLVWWWGIGDINLYRRWRGCGHGRISTMIPTLSSDTAKQTVCHPPNEAHIFIAQLNSSGGHTFDPLDRISLNHKKKY